MEALEGWVLALPKVELHVHLDGAFDRALLFELAKRKVEDLPLEVWVLFLENACTHRLRTSGTSKAHKHFY